MASEGDSDSSFPSPSRTQYFSSDMEASGEESEPRPAPGKAPLWLLKRQGQKVSPPNPNPPPGRVSESRSEGPPVLVMSLQQGAPILSPDKQHWYGSEEFLALPAQLRKTEMLALRLEHLAPLVTPP